MPEFLTSNDQKPGLIWLVRLRWCAFVAQALLLLLLSQVAGIPLPMVPLASIIGLGLISNFGLGYLARNWPEERRVTGSVILFDIILLTALLYFSGGPTNPFSIVYLVHVSLATLLLGERWTWTVALLSSLCFGALFLDHVPVDGFGHHMESGFSIHLQGMWFAFFTVAIVSAYFLTRIASALKAKDRHLSEMRLLSASQEKLASLTTLAAGAAHELATPLSTIAVVVKELERSLERSEVRSEGIAADLGLIASEVKRCKAILSEMSLDAGRLAGEMPREVTAGELEKLLVEGLLPEWKKRLSVTNFVPSMRMKLPLSAIQKALNSLIKNAFDASPTDSSVMLSISEKAERIIFSVKDSGSGMPDDVLKRVGEPFFTTKEPGRGMGLGVFLARLLGERLGGTVRFNSQVGQGTEAILQIPAGVM